jgi:hypothetical protein
LAGKIKQEANEIEAELLEQAGEDVSDHDKAAIKNAAIVKALMNNDEATKAIGVDRKTIGKIQQTQSEVGMARAEASGLYDSDWMGNSELDASKLEGASIQSLQAIVQDDDLSEEDMGLVKAELEKKKSESASVIESATTPTAQAIENRTDEAGGGPTTDTAPIVIANNAPPAPPAPSEEPHIAIMPARIRTANSSIQRFQDKRFA